MTLPAYLPILFLVILSTLFAVGSIFAASKLSPKRWTVAKLQPYESGIVPEETDDRYGRRGGEGHGLARFAARRPGSCPRGVVGSGRSVPGYAVHSPARSRATRSPPRHAPGSVSREKVK